MTLALDNLLRFALVLPLTSVAACSEVADDGADGAGDGDDGHDGADEVGDGDGDGSPDQLECSPDQLDLCPADTKCTAVVAPDGHSYEFQCVMDQGDLTPGAVCIPSPPTGVDGCPSGYACIPDTNLEPSEGHCLRLCEDDPVCLDGLCAAMPASPVRVCAQYCNPLLANCPATHACRLLEDRGFGCVIPLPDDIGVQNSQCDGINQLGCADGFVCATSFQVPECFDSDFCCTAVCPVDGMDDCPQGTTCESLTLEDDVLFENVGLCAA